MNAAFKFIVSNPKQTRRGDWIR